MEDDKDKITCKIERNNNMDNNSNSSRESLENRLLSYTQPQENTDEQGGGEKIKFFFNIPAESKIQKKEKKNYELNLPFNKNNSNFKEILLNYINSNKHMPKPENDSQHEGRNSRIIYKKPNSILTLNGDELNSNDSKKLSRPNSNSTNKENGNKLNKQKEKKIEFKQNKLKNEDSDSKKIIMNKFKGIKNMESYRGSVPNTFTTATNTHNTILTYNSSVHSLKINNKKKYLYNYMNNLSLEKYNHIITNSNKLNNNIDNNTFNIIKKLKYLNLSLDVEKSYIKDFNTIIYSKSKKDLGNEDNQFFYPNEYYINKNNNLHDKYHVSNFFKKIREQNE